MPDVSDYRHGMPCWVDLATTDPDGARAFYRELLGWTAVRGPGGTPYEVMHVRERPVGGMMPLSPQMLAAGVPPTWTTYVYVDDVDDAVTAARAAGGQVPAPAFEPAAGLRIAVAIDPGGAVIGFLEGPRGGGARVAGEPGAVAWWQLGTGAPEAVATFYEDVFAWDAEPADGDNRAVLFLAEGRRVAGMGAMDDGEPSRWTVAFAVDDADAAAARARELGGASLGPMRTVAGGGRLAPLADPQGGAFAVVAPEAPS